MIKNNFNLQQNNTFGLSSIADSCFVLRRESELDELAAYLNRNKETGYFVLGGGSNVILNAQINTLVVLNQLKGISLTREDEDFFYVRAAAGENWHQFVDLCLQNGWPGLENLALIPGTVGASPVQNIGAYGLELQSRCHRVFAFDPHSGQHQEYAASDCEFAYRHSVFKTPVANRLIITAVEFALPKRWKPRINYPDLKNHFTQASAPPTPQAIFEAVCQIRRQKLPDPAIQGNAGSFFKNPIVPEGVFDQLKQQHPDMPAYRLDDGRVKLAAAWLIDQSGWKGHRQSRVGVHDRQALVLVNLGGAVFEDVRELARLIASDVEEKYGVRLEPEPVFVS